MSAPWIDRRCGDVDGGFGEAHAISAGGRLVIRVCTCGGVTDEEVLSRVGGLLARKDGDPSCFG